MQEEPPKRQDPPRQREDIEDERASMTGKDRTASNPKGADLIEKQFTR